jgi:hypothetical protein
MMLDLVLDFTTFHMDVGVVRLEEVEEALTLVSQQEQEETLTRPRVFFKRTFSDHLTVL